MKRLFSVFVLFLLGACNGAANHKVVMPEKTYDDIQWKNEEKNKDIAVRSLNKSADSSAHLMLIKGKEFPHYHDKHDLNGTVLSGKVKIHFKDHSVLLKAGDTLFIPKGTYHWAENSNEIASEIFVVFSPAFDGKDRRKAD